MNLYEDGKRYYTLNNFFLKKFNSKVFKVGIDAGFTCPNIDGKVGLGGCIFCSNGSYDTVHEDMDLKAQFNKVKNTISKKWPNSKYIAYFQAHSNTYAKVNILKEKFESVLTYDNVCGLAIATRCDCIDDDILAYLDDLNKRTFLMVELGLQTIHEKTSKLINRCHTLKCFDDTVKKLKEKNIMVIVHIINGLPYEDKEMMLDTVRHLNKLKIDGIKIHMLNIVKNTKIAKMYKTKPFKLLSKEEYVDIVCDQIEELNKNIVIHRLTSDPLKDILIEPIWLLKKFGVLNEIDKTLKQRQTYQGFNKTIFNKLHQVLDSLVKSNDIVVDATIGNGFDTMYLANLANKGFVYGFDIQDKAIFNTKKLLKENNISNYQLFKENHKNIYEVLKEYENKISCIVYNLGYLPNGNKKITTKCDTTIKSITNAIKLLNNKGVILIIAYPHKEGKKESKAILNLKIDGYTINKYTNTKNINAPFLIEIKKISN